MRRRQSLPRHAPPRLWLMTDERMGAGLWDALARLPKGAGVIFRHYRTAPTERRALFERVRRIAQARRLALVLAGAPREAAAWRADGVHGYKAHKVARPLLRTTAVHDARAMIAARRAGMNMALVSPVFATRSHPGGRTLGAVGFGMMARGTDVGRGKTRSRTRPLPIALGGMTARRFARLKPLGAYGWAAIDAWTTPAGRSDQKRKVVPR